MPKAVYFSNYPLLRAVDATGRSLHTQLREFKRVVMKSLMEVSLDLKINDPWVQSTPAAKIRSRFPCGWLQMLRMARRKTVLHNGKINAKLDLAAKGDSHVATHHTEHKKNSMRKVRGVVKGTKFYIHICG